MKKILMVILAITMGAASLTAFCSCKNDESGNNPPQNEPETIEYNLMVGESSELKVDKDHDVFFVEEWKVTDTAIATIDKKANVIIGMKAGSTTMQAIDEDNKVYVEYNVTVSDYDLQGKFSQRGSVSFSSEVINLDTEYTERWGIPQKTIGQPVDCPWTSIKVWYPADMASTNKTYPVIAFSNGSDGTYDHELSVALEEHLASYGFIVIGNDETNDGHGKAVAASVLWVLNANNNSESKFYHKIDTENIGVLGLSQGGAGAINAAATIVETKDKIKTVCTMSVANYNYTKSPDMQWYANDFSYALVKQPYFMMCSTGLWDNILVGLDSINGNYNECDKSPFVVKGRINYCDHTDMTVEGLSYATAWYLFQLQNDAEAAKVFTGSEPEIENNARWLDVGIKTNS